MIEVIYVLSGFFCTMRKRVLDEKIFFGNYRVTIIKKFCWILLNVVKVLFENEVFVFDLFLLLFWFFS